MEYEVIQNISDEMVRKMEQEHQQYIDRNKALLVKCNGIEIGFSLIYFICGRLTIEYYLFKEFQHKGYGAGFVNVVSDFIGAEYFNNDFLYLIIHRDNVPSMKVAGKCGFKASYLDYDFNEIIHEEMPDYYVYSKRNSYYNKDADNKEIQDIKKLKKILDNK